MAYAQLEDLEIGTLSMTSIYILLDASKPPKELDLEGIETNVDTQGLLKRSESVPRSTVWPEEYGMGRQH